MKNVFLAIVALVLITSCEKENIVPAPSTIKQEITVNNDLNLDNANDPILKDQASKTEDRSANKVTICHKTANGQYNTISINENAVPAHLAHGDYFPEVWYLDADNDGYTVGSGITQCISPGEGYRYTGILGVDCNDLDATVNPGAEEICYNDIDDDCDEQIDEGCCGIPIENGTLFVAPNNGPAPYYTGDEAENYCENLELGGCTDWHLPTNDEMQVIFLNSDIIGGLAWGCYWLATNTNEPCRGSFCAHTRQGGTENNICDDEAVAFSRCVRR